MQLFYAADFTAPEYTLSEEESRHAVKVLRLVEGDTLHITDGRGSLYRCEVASAHQKHCLVRVVEHFEEFEKMPYRLTMAVAPTKNIDRYEWFLEKATEIGVTEVVPIVGEHSERKVIKAEREEKVITAAVKQSLKAYHPHLAEITPFAKLVRAEFTGRKFIAHCGDAVKEKRYLASTLRKGEDVMILIGPEGDFSPEEVQLAVANGFEEITLGTQRFRTETAAVVAVDMVSIINNL
jgi:16S rRNA (uracil1498-N3)-methyltransferase